MRQLDPTARGRLKPVLDEWCVAILGLRHLMQNSPSGFALVVHVLLEGDCADASTRVAALKPLNGMFSPRLLWARQIATMSN